MHKPILFKISITNFALESSWNNSAKPTWNRLCFFSIIYNIMDNLKYSVTFTLNFHRFGSMRKQNIEKLLQWLRTTGGIGLMLILQSSAKLYIPSRRNSNLQHSSCNRSAHTLMVSVECNNSAITSVPLMSVEYSICNFGRSLG